MYACLHDAISLASSSAPDGHLHMGLLVGIWIILRPLSQLFGDDILVQGDQTSLHLLLDLQSSTGFDAFSTDACSQGLSPVSQDTTASVHRYAFRDLSSSRCI